MYIDHNASYKMIYIMKSSFLVQYIVKSRAMPWNFTRSLNLPMDIIIGTIPITPSRSNPENATENVDNQQQQPIEDRESI